MREEVAAPHRLPVPVLPLGDPGEQAGDFGCHGVVTPLGLQQMRADHHELPTPRTTLRTGYVRVLVWCKACRHRRDADLQGPDRRRRGDVPLVELRFRCANCGSRLTDFVVTATE